MKSTLKRFQIDGYKWTNQKSTINFKPSLGRMTKTVFNARPVSDVVSLSRLSARRTECHVESRRSIMTRNGEQQLEKLLPQLLPNNYPNYSLKFRYPNPLPKIHPLPKINPLLPNLPFFDIFDNFNKIDWCYLSIFWEN